MANKPYYNESITVKTAIGYAVICILIVNLAVGYSFMALHKAGIIGNLSRFTLLSNIMIEGLSALICALRYRKAPRSHIDVKINPVMIAAIAIISISFIDFSNNVVSLADLEQIDPFYHHDMADLMNGAPALVIINAVIAAPVFEELMFRGMIYRGIRNAAGFWPAAVISSAFWGALHMNFVQGVAVFLMGILFAFIYEVFRNIWITVIIHAANNAVGLMTTGNIGSIMPNEVAMIILCIVELAITIYICRGLWKVRRDDIKGKFDRMPSEIKSFDVE